MPAPAYALNPAVADVAEPPIPEVNGWIPDRAAFPVPVIDLARAVPGYPPPPALVDAFAAIAREPGVELYTPILGLPELRAALADDISRAYGGRVRAAQVGVTAGGNQAFTSVLMALCGPGDEVLLPAPAYFNHPMWMEMTGVRHAALPFRPDRGGVPDPADAEGRIGPRTRAIVLVSPNNPTGAVCPPDVIRAFRDLAARRGLALVLDETYRDFLGAEGPAHGLFADPDWDRTLVHLYSFSKAFCMTGHRVGAVAGHPDLIALVAKVMDCVAICAPHPGQRLALHALTRLSGFRAEGARVMAERLSAFRAALADAAPAWEVASAGAFFAYVAHPFGDAPSKAVARALAQRHGVLAVPGSAFGPGQERFIRFAVANADAALMPEVARRLARFAREGLDPT